MYNGIGVQTTRGTGTNGYVQRNLSHIRTDKKDNRSTYNFDSNVSGGFESSIAKKPNKEILEHDRKRQVEVKCLELQDTLEDEGIPVEEITIKVNELRKVLLEQKGLMKQKTDEQMTSTFGSHQIAEANENKNAKMRNAFGIKQDFVEGSSFQEEHQKARRESEKQEQEERYKEREKQKERVEKEYRKKREDKEREVRYEDHHDEKYNEKKHKRGRKRNRSTGSSSDEGYYDHIRRHSKRERSEEKRTLVDHYNSSPERYLLPKNQRSEMKRHKYNRKDRENKDIEPGDLSDDEEPHSRSRNKRFSPSPERRLHRNHYYDNENRSHNRHARRKGESDNEDERKSKNRDDDDGSDKGDREDDSYYYKKEQERLERRKKRDEEKHAIHGQDKSADDQKLNRKERDSSVDRHIGESVDKLQKRERIDESPQQRKDRHRKRSPQRRDRHREISVDQFGRSSERKNDYEQKEIKQSRRDSYDDIEISRNNRNGDRNGSHDKELDYSVLDEQSCRSEKKTKNEKKNYRPDRKDRYKDYKTNDSIDDFENVDFKRQQQRSRDVDKKESSFVLDKYSEDIAVREFGFDGVPERRTRDIKAKDKKNLGLTQDSSYNHVDPTSEVPENVNHASEDYDSLLVDTKKTEHQSDMEISESSDSETRKARVAKEITSQDKYLFDSCTRKPLEDGFNQEPTKLRVEEKVKECEAQLNQAEGIERSKKLLLPTKHKTSTPAKKNKDVKKESKSPKKKKSVEFPGKDKEDQRKEEEEQAARKRIAELEELLRLERLNRKKERKTEKKYSSKTDVDKQDDEEVNERKQLKLNSSIDKKSRDKKKSRDAKRKKQEISSESDADNDNDNINDKKSKRREESSKRKNRDMSSDDQSEDEKKESKSRNKRKSTKKSKKIKVDTQRKVYGKYKIKKQGSCERSKNAVEDDDDMERIQRVSQERKESKGKVKIVKNKKTMKKHYSSDDESSGDEKRKKKKTLTKRNKKRKDTSSSSESSSSDGRSSSETTTSSSSSEDTSSDSSDSDSESSASDSESSRSPTPKKRRQKKTYKRVKKH